MTSPITPIRDHTILTPVEEYHFQQRLAAMADLLRHHRTQADMSQEKLGQLMRIHQGNVSRLERGLEVPSLRRLWQWSGAFDLTPGLFSTRDDDD